MEETTLLNSLAIRLHSKSSYVASIGADTIGFNYFEDIFGLLVSIQADRIVELQRNEVAQLKLSDSELIEAGIRNVKEKYSQNISPVRLLDYNFWLVENEYYFAPNFLLDFHNYPNLIGSYGSLFSIPNGDRLLVYPVENVETASALFAFAKMSQYFYECQAEPLSPKYIGMTRVRFSSFHLRLKIRIIIYFQRNF